jgi:hypothetical protein
MKFLNKILLTVGITGAALSLQAQTSYPHFVTYNHTGTTAADILIPNAPQSQIRIVSAIESSDLATAGLSLYSGITASSTAIGTVTNGTNLILLSVTGFTIPGYVSVHIPGYTNITLGAASVSGTNITMSNTMPFTVPAGIEVESLQAVPQILSCGVSTNKTFVSDGLFVGQPGLDVWAHLTGTSACTNYITAHLDNTSGQ